MSVINKSKSLARAGLVDQAVDAILVMIAEQGLQPGDHLPSQADLMEQLGIGRTSLREAIQRLVVLGAVTVTSGKRMSVGPMIRSNRPATAAELEASMRHAALRELTEVRDLLEPQAAALAAQRITDDLVLRLENIVDEMKVSKDSATDFHLNTQFHATIAEATQNEALQHILKVVADMLAPLQGHMYERALENYRADQEHLPILQALKNRDPDKARKAMHDHIGIFSRFVASNYANPSNSEPDSS
ncbi:FadR/GntR family transcriptional regulator [Candidatus Leptofilum sp.]|uniref:FadR/GntR family transcriptional regulator n=1 Tax=Candidatus Leptofilum sp. TaxID=3241576 RepID=UPI003B5AED87